MIDQSLRSIREDSVKQFDRPFIADNVVKMNKLGERLVKIGRVNQFHMIVDCRTAIRFQALNASNPLGRCFPPILFRFHSQAPRLAFST